MGTPQVSLRMIYRMLVSIQLQTFHRISYQREMTLNPCCAGFHVAFIHIQEINKAYSYKPDPLRGCTRSFCLDNSVARCKYHDYQSATQTKRLHGPLTKGRKRKVHNLDESVEVNGIHIYGCYIPPSGKYGQILHHLMSETRTWFPPPLPPRHRGRLQSIYVLPAGEAKFQTMGDWHYWKPFHRWSLYLLILEVPTSSAKER